MYTPKNKQSKSTLYAKSDKIKNLINNDDSEIDKDAIKIFDKIYQKYEYVFQELAK